MRTLALLLSGFVPLTLLAQAAPLSSVLQPYVDDHTVAGSVVLVASSDQILDLTAVGFSNLAAHTPMQPDCLFGIASMGKPIAASAVLMLVDAGQLSLDDPVEKYIPAFHDATIVDPKDPAHAPRPLLHPVTIRQLLTHTSGLPYSAPEERPTLDGHTLQDAVALYAHTPLLFEPGTGYAYSSAGINTAARIVEIVSQLPYEQFLQERLFIPLGMRDTTFFPTEAQLLRQAKFYKSDAAHTGLEEAFPGRFTYPLSDRILRHPIPGSGLFSTAHDLARFCQMILNHGALEGRRYLSASAVQQMTTRQTGLAADYGFGWALGPGSFGHGGSFKTQMEIYPAQDLIVISLQQIDGPWPTPQGEKLIPSVLAAAREKFSRP